MANQENLLPFISAMIVARNESAYIEKSLNSLINQTYPKDRYEILLIDGNSNDNTVEIAKNTVRSYCENNGNRSFNIKFLENPRQILAAGWNIGIKNSKGQYVVRIDAHSFVPPDYISKCVAVMLKVKDAVCVGGVINSDTIGEKGKAVSYVLSSPFGIGNSKFRYSQKAEYVDTVAFGLYRKDIFEKVGYFDENLQRNQDIELHAKIRAAGGKFYLDTKINLTYFSRNTTKSMIEQGYQNGKWNAIVFKKNPKSLSIRHIIPLLFVLGIIGCILLGFVSSFLWYVLFIVFVLHLILGVVFALKKTKKLSYILTMPIMFMLLHISYGTGTLINLVIPYKRTKS